MFTQDLEAIDALRSGAIHAVEPHQSGIRKLQAYAAQLVWIGGKFPVDIGVDFSWYPALGYNVQRPVSENNIRFELANVLFNLAAMYSQLATSTNRTTADGLKLACNYFCLAAGVLSHLKVNDMDTVTLESLEHLMLAQAQECFWQKAVKDGLKDASISKLAAKVSDLYSDASDWGIKSDAYRAARDCLEKRKYGEEVARLRDSLVCANEALKEARYINKTVLGDLSGLKNRVTEDLKRAEKDNDMIYLQPVPPKSELKTLDRATMVSAKTPKEVSDPLAMLGDNSDLGRPLFSKLVPYSVHIAASIYADRRDRLVAKTIDELEGLTARIHEVLKSLNLPGSLQALEKPLGLPPGLVSHAEEIRQQDGLSRLYRSIDETEKLKEQDRAVYQEGVDHLRQEAAEDERTRRKYGTDRWSRAPSADAAPKLYAQVNEIDGYLKSAANSDQIVQSKIKDSESHIRLLSGTDHDLEQFVPSSRRVTMTAAVEREATNLRGCLNEISRLESRRKRKIEALKAKARQDDINPELLKETARLEREYPMQNIEAVQFEDLFEKRLHKYDVDNDMVADEDQEQQAIIKRLEDANAAFVSARRGDSSTRQREQALQQLENAYFKYKEIISNLDVGRKFYNDLAKICGRFRDDCRNFAYQRRAEATQFESDLSTAMSSLHLQQANALQEQRQADQDNRPYPAPAHADQPAIPAPTPTRASMVMGPTNGMWTPEMPIRFGTAQGGDAKPGPGTDARWDPSKGMKFA
ncbi:ALIX V-shaped domain binding to HIV-domain-containing protein [Macrophomina phaseolina]|uniref:ALIX V-shaped domain binding to HIV-domain-containing protein n=1 Tax=Macrophomina phaseolina TaxID=35725 RepID=A0ABQ8GNW5_9PEZI|nr:ALIX V-shaped domain binding to HIV-domain-containing protein [Macrophomina phaseolina]